MRLSHLIQRSGDGEACLVQHIVRHYRLQAVDEESYFRAHHSSRFVPILTRQTLAQIVERR